MLFRMLAMFMAAILLSRSEGEWVVIKHLEPNHYNFHMTTQSPTVNQSMTTQKYKTLQDLLLNVHRSLIKESSQPFYRRFNFLNGLKSDLMHQMWTECHNVWSNRADIQGRSHMKHFPSLEGALLTISFLTFAVFLIKVVKQFIQGLQGMNGNNTVMQMQLAQPAKVVKHKRETEYMNLADKILQYIHDFQTVFLYPTFDRSEIVMASLSGSRTTRRRVRDYEDILRALPRKFQDSHDQNQDELF